MILPIGSTSWLPSRFFCPSWMRAARKSLRANAQRTKRPHAVAAPNRLGHTTHNRALADVREASPLLDLTGTPGEEGHVVNGGPTTSFHRGRVIAAVMMPIDRTGVRHVGGTGTIGRVDTIHAGNPYPLERYGVDERMTDDVTSLTVGDPFPSYTVTVVNGGDLSNVDAQNPYDHFSTARNSDHHRRWRVIFFWTRDADPLSQEEIALFASRYEEFRTRNVSVLGVSVDNKYRHFYWRVNHANLRKLPFPIASDFNRVLTSDVGLLGADGVAQRRTFVVDSRNTIRLVLAVSKSAAEHVNEIICSLDDLKAGVICDGPSDALLGLARHTTVNNQWTFRPQCRARRP